jgi:hypothetical protein
MGSDFYPTIIAGIDLSKYAKEEKKHVEVQTYDRFTGKPKGKETIYKHLVTVFGREYEWSEFDLNLQIAESEGFTVECIPTWVMGIQFDYRKLGIRLDGGYTYCVALKDPTLLLELCLITKAAFAKWGKLENPDIKLWFGIKHSY